MVGKTVSEKKLRLVVGSTPPQFGMFREEAQDAIVAFGFQPVLSEYTLQLDGKAVNEGLEFCSTDIYIGILSCDFSAQHGEPSITEMELNQATAQGIPCLCFVADEEIEEDTIYIRESDRKKLEFFKARFDEEVIMLMFTSRVHLGLQILKSLFNVNFV